MWAHALALLCAGVFVGAFVREFKHRSEEHGKRKAESTAPTEYQPEERADNEAPKGQTQ